MGINIIKKTSSKNTGAKYGRNIKYIVIHYTAGTTSRPGSAVGVATMFATTAQNASADFIVDDANIVQYNPDLNNRYCYHCGGGKYFTKGGSLFGVVTNSNSIGIEVCSTNSQGRITDANDKYWSFTDAVLRQAKDLVKHLMREYKIDINHVVRHYDVNGKPCPGIIGWNADAVNETKWLAFKNQIREEMEDEDMTGEEIYKRLKEYMATLPVPEWAEKELQEAKDAGITDGSNPMQFCPRYQTAIMIKRGQK